jgi:hypothetical protein
VLRLSWCSVGSEESSTAGYRVSWVTEGLLRGRGRLPPPVLGVWPVAVVGGCWCS